MGASLLHLSADDLERALPLEAALEAAAEAFGALADGAVRSLPRGALPLDGGGHLLTMGATGPVGTIAKAVTVTAGGGAQAVATLFEPSGTPAAVLDGTALTAQRTGAAGGLAARLLAPEGATVGAVIGAGRQARTQLLALDAALALEELRVCDGGSGAAVRLAAEVDPATRAKVIAVDGAQAALDGAQVVAAATSSEVPVFDDAWLAEDCHVTGVGSYHLGMRELPAETIARCTVFIDDLESAVAEAGELVAAEAAGRTRREEWILLGEVVRGRRPGRSGGGVTVFKSVGHAAQDLFAARRAVDLHR